MPMGIVKRLNMGYTGLGMPVGRGKRLNIGHTRLSVPVGTARELYVNAGQIGRGFVLTGTCMTGLRHTWEIIIP